MSEPLGDDDSVMNYENDALRLNWCNLDAIRREGKFCDVTLKADSQSFSAHRVVLAATIPYFNAMFSHDMAESQMREITIQCIGAPTLESLINYAYTGRITIGNFNVQNLMMGASYFQLTKLGEACAEFLSQMLDPSNVLGIRAFADCLGDTGLTERTEIYLQQYFHNVTYSEEFVSLPLAGILDIVKRDNLNVASEEQVFEAIIRWVEKFPASRRKQLPILLDHVRLPLLTPQYLTNRVAANVYVKMSHECRDLIDEARNYHLMPDRRFLMKDYKTKTRCCNYVVGHIYAVGGLTKSGDSENTVELFDPILGKWQLSEPMSTMRSRVGVAVLGNHLYAIGGYDGSERLRTVEFFDPCTKNWKSVHPMRYKRSAVGAAALNGQLYVCGGFDGQTSLNAVERYSPEKDRWGFVSGMIGPRSAGAVIALDGLIYALGGHNGLSILNTVERYNPHTGRWVTWYPMLNRRCRLGVAVLNGRIYVCGGYDGTRFLRTAEVFDPETDKWHYIAPMNVMRSRVSLVANLGKLWAIGGYDGFTTLSAVECYDPKTNSWSFVSSMCAHEGGVGVGVLPVL